MVSASRWRAAQRYERSFWEQNAAQISTGAVSQLDWYAWRADRLAERLGGLGLQHLARGAADVLEIGGGPIGIVARFPSKTRTAVDPLEPFYRSDPVLTALRSPEVQYLEGMGENLPGPDSSVDLVIIDNCIDHCRDVAAVMDEIARVLRPGGVLFLTVNCRTAWGFLMHRTLSRLRIDAGHPYTFTPSRLKALITSGPLRLRQFEVEDAAHARRAQLASSSLRSRMKGLLGSTDFAAVAVAERLPAAHGNGNGR